MKCSLFVLGLIACIGLAAMPSARAETGQGSQTVETTPGAGPLAAASAAIARTEARKRHAVERLEAEAGRVDAEMAEAITAEIQTAVARRMAGIRAVFDRAKIIVVEEFGYSDAFDGLWKQLVSDQEARQEFLRTHVMDALEAAGYREAIEDFSNGITEDLREIATNRYLAHKDQVDAILFEAVSADNLLGSATKAAFAALQEDFRRLKVEQTVQDPEIGQMDVPSAVPDKLFIGLVGKMLMKGIGRALLARAGVIVGGQLVAKIMAAPVLGPVGLLVGAGALAWDFTEFRSAMAGSITEAIDRIYEETVAAELTAPALIETLSSATVASLQQQFSADARLAKQALESFFQGIFEQAQSPGYAAFQQAQSPEAAFEALKKVSLVFQRGYLELPFAEKYHLASSLPMATVREAMTLNGSGFLALYRGHPALVQELAQAPQHRLFLRTALQDAQPLAAIRFFQTALGRFGVLTDTQAAALNLVRRYAPELSVESLSLPLLEIVGAHAQRVDGVFATHADTGTAILTGLADGSLAYGLFDRILRGPAPGVHLVLLGRLGADRYAARIVKPGHTAVLVDFVNVYGLERAASLLQEDGVDYLEAHRSLGGGGTRAVEVVERLRDAYGGAVPAPILKTLDWVLRSVSVNADRIDRRYLESLTWLGLDGETFPDLIAVPLAELVAMLGWPVRVLVLLLALVLVLPVLRFIVRRLFRQLRPSRSQALARIDPHSLEVSQR